MKIPIEFIDVSVGYDEPIISSISTKLYEGDICVVLGRNGSGKSTLIKSILKTIALKSGNIRVDNQELNKYSEIQLSKKISVVYSNNQLENKVKVYDLIALGRYPFKKWYEKLNTLDKQLIEKAVKYCRIQNIIDKNAHELSDGNLQKVYIARAIVQDTPIILLDEPLSHLDIENQFMIMKIFENLSKKENKTLIFTSHEWDMSLTIAKKLWYIKNERLYSGWVEDVAIKESIINEFSNTHFEFNFYLNKFIQKVDNQSSKSVCVICESGKDETIYWLTRVLKKHNITLDENASIQIIPLEDGYKIKSQSSEKAVTTIEELIEYLK